MPPTPATHEVIDGASDDVVEAEVIAGDDTRGRSAVTQAQAASASQAAAQTSAQSTATTTAEPDHGEGLHGTSTPDAVAHDDTSPDSGHDSGHDTATADGTTDAPNNPYLVHDDPVDDGVPDHAADGTDSPSE